MYFCQEFKFSIIYLLSPKVTPVSYKRKCILFYEKIFISFTVKFCLGNKAQFMVQSFNTLKAEMFCTLMVKTR